MSGYIYSVYELSQLDGKQARMHTTRKYEATRFLERELGEGKSLSSYEVSRSRDGKVDIMTYVDPYEFMQIDLGEVD